MHIFVLNAPVFMRNSSCMLSSLALFVVLHVQITLFSSFALRVNCEHFPLSCLHTQRNAGDEECNYNPNHHHHVYKHAYTPTLIEEFGIVFSKPLFLCLVAGYAAQTAMLIGLSTFGSAFMMGLGYFDTVRLLGTVGMVCRSISFVFCVCLIHMCHAGSLHFYVGLAWHVIYRVAYVYPHIIFIMCIEHHCRRASRALYSEP